MSESERRLWMRLSLSCVVVAAAFTAAAAAVMVAISAACCSSSLLHAKCVRLAAGDGSDVVLSSIRSAFACCCAFCAGERAKQSLAKRAEKTQNVRYWWRQLVAFDSRGIRSTFGTVFALVTGKVSSGNNGGAQRTFCSCEFFA